MPSAFATCRFCKKCAIERARLKLPRTEIVKYGVRHNAHLACLAERGRLEETLRLLSEYQLDNLPALELQELGVLDLARRLRTVNNHRRVARLAGRSWTCDCVDCTAERSQ